MRRVADTSSARRNSVVSSSSVGSVAISGANLARRYGITQGGMWSAHDWLAAVMAPEQQLAEPPGNPLHPEMAHWPQL